MFCGATGGLTQEHIFPAWLERYVPGDGDFTMYRAKTTDREVLSEATWSTRELDVRVGAVCHNCNHGWMSDLETAVQPIMRPILLEQDTMLSGDERLTLARWICKTGIVMNAWKGPRVCHFAAGSSASPSEPVPPLRARRARTPHHRRRPRRDPGALISALDVLLTTTPDEPVDEERWL